jgi:hypothetical protein
MLSRKNKDKTSKSGLAGKYISTSSLQFWSQSVNNANIFHNFFILQKKKLQNLKVKLFYLTAPHLSPFDSIPVINVWTENDQKNTKTKNRSNSNEESVKLKINGSNNATFNNISTLCVYQHESTIASI